MAVEFFALLFLSIISLCLITLTAASLTLFTDLRRVLRQLESGLPVCTRAFKELHQTLEVARQLITRTHKAGQQMEDVVHKTCDAAMDAIEPFVVFGEKVRTFLAQRFGNGARAKPRRVIGK